jgi:hypothetical protein
LDIPDWDVEDEQENPEDDDEILYPRYHKACLSSLHSFVTNYSYPRKSISPVHVLPSPPSRPSPVSPIHSPIGTTPRSLARPSTLVTPTTAQDLLFGMLPVSRPHPSQSSAPQPPLLFGSGPPNRPGHSIWSTTLDDRSPTFPGTSSQPGQLHHAYPQHYPASSQEQPQLIWSPHQHTSPIPPNAPAVGDTSLPLTPQQQHSIISGTHHRTASSPVLVSRPFTNQNQIVHDPFGYSSLVPPHVQRPSQHERYTNAPVASSASQMFYGQEDYLNYHSHHMDQGHGSGVGPFTTQPLSRVWGNPG